MQYILSVDATTQPAQAVIVRVDGKIVEIIEKREIDLVSRLAEPRMEARAEAVDEVASPASDESENGAGEEDDLSIPKAARTIATTRDKLFDAPEYPTGGLLDAGPVNLHEALETPWSNAIVIVPPEDYLSLNLELPFSDPRNISRILDLEVQDVVPFDVSEFLLQHQSIGPLSASSFDVHVSAIPKIYVRRVLEACRHFGIEPLIISTPSSIAGALFHIAPDYFAKNSAIVVAQDPFYYMTSCFDGQIRSERLIRRNQPRLADGEARGGDSEENAEQGLLLDLRMTIASMEHRYGKQVECLYLIESSRPVWRDVSDLKQAVGRNVERINLTEMGRSLESHTAMAGIAAVFAQDVDAPSILTNFRTREFSYSPPLKEVMAGLRQLLPLIVSGALLFVLTLVSVYYLRERHSDKLHDAMIEEIRAAVPDLSLEEGNELQQLQRQNAALDEQLKDLGSPSSLSPLDILLEISRDFPVTSDTYLTSISIRGTHLKIDGVAPNYAAVDKIEKALNKRKKSLYCRIKKDTGSYSQSPGARSFTFDIWMCE